MPPTATAVAARTFPALGTFATLLVADPEALGPAHDLLAAELDAMDAACSRFRRDSELWRVNHARGRPVPVSRLFADALAVALDAAEITDGDVDPTCGRSLVRLGYDRDFAQARRHTGPLRQPPMPAGGWRRVELDRGQPAVRVPPGILLDLGATAKALAADRAAAAIEAATGCGVLVNLGGDIRVAGDPPDGGWRVGIADDAGFDASTASIEPRQVVMVSNGGLATSSTLGRAWRRGGTDLHHIIDPATGRPARSCWRTVSVAAASCVDANIASTAAILRGDRAIRWLDGLRLPRLLTGIGAAAGLREHERHYGPLPDAGPSAARSRSLSRVRRPERLIDMVEAAGLTGRGGAGFPAGRKMRSVAAGSGRKAVVANGAEGEPASRKDRLLLTRLPHLVMDGITLAAQVVGADEAYLCVHGTEGVLLDHLDHAVAERRAAGLDPVPIQVTGIPGRYVSSEQSSIVQYLNGGPGKPTFSPPRPHERGVNGKPTLVHNVETLAHLALIARRGDRWFRGAGLPSAPGSMLVTVSGAVTRPGVYEIEMGTAAGEVIMLAGGPAERLQALLVGGYFGAWLPLETAWQAPMTHAGLKAAGGALGAGIVIAWPAAVCPIAETARVVRYLAEESAGQCGPCVFGLPALADALASLAFSGGRERGIDDVAALIPLIERRGACRHPDGAAQLVRSLLTAFPADAHWHQWQGACDGVRRPPLLPLPGDEERDWDWG